jgi:hypothetical protein
MEVLKILVWPIAVIIIVIIVVLLLKKSLQDLLTRVTKLKYGETVAEVSQVRQEANEKSLIAQSQVDKPNETIEKALGIFSSSTIDRAKNVVETESKINELTDDSKKVDRLIKYSEALYLILSFERLYNSIFGSQLYILDFINTINTETKNDLKVFYDNAKEKYPDFYETYSYDEYFNFLLNHELIIINKDNTCSITWLGRDFLKYLIETGKTISKRF